MKQHRYRITIEYLALPGGSAPAAPVPCILEMGTHDEVLGIVARARQRGDLPDGDAAAFVLGLKLFSEVMLQHRGLPLFSEFAPHFKDFMRRLKQPAAPVGAVAPAQDGRQAAATMRA